MTLILSVQGRESIWFLADRRLSYVGRDPKDDARKFMLLDTTDGTAILGYAGLGATALGTEPADWMSAVLRGRNLPLEQSLNELAETLKKQLPRHMLQMPGPNPPTHNVVVTAFINDEVRLYSIDLAFAADRKDSYFRYTRHFNRASGRAPRIGIGGSGGQYLSQDKHWTRPLLRLVNAYDRGQVSARSVADHLASLNNKVHRGVPDKTVGPNCIVAWRNKKSGFHKGGGGHQSYNAEARDASSSSLPTIVNGMDLHAVAGVLASHWTKQAESMLLGGPAEELNEDEINEELARLPDKPDENLR